MHNRCHDFNLELNALVNFHISVITVDLHCGVGYGDSCMFLNVS